MSTTVTSKCTLAGAGRGAAPRRLAPAAKFATLLADRLWTWLRRMRERRDLSMLDDHMLKDIGVTRADVEFEAQKHFWMP
jgi:uncharacterized protein YjiS (DUF1127 family)